MRGGRGVLASVICFPFLMAAGGSRADGALAGAEFLNFPLSVRQSGMGETAAGGTDLMRAWSNPALLADGEAELEAAASGGSRQSGLHSGGGLGIGYRPFPTLSIGALVTRWSVSTEEVDRLALATGSSLGQTVQAISIPVAFSSGAVRVGLGIKYIAEELLGDHAAAAAADAGARLDWGTLSASASLRNLGMSLRQPGGIAGMSESMPLEMRGGLSWIHESLHLTGALELVRPRGLPMSLGAGVEWWPIPLAGVRAGVVRPTAAADRQLGGGLSLAWRGLGLDYAIGSQPGGTMHLVALSWLKVRPAREPGEGRNEGVLEGPVPVAPSPAPRSAPPD